MFYEVCIYIFMKVKTISYKAIHENEYIYSDFANTDLFERL